MLPTSLAVILAGLVMGVLALAAFAWAWRRGQFDHLDVQARLPLEPRDWRVERPWESPEQRAERTRIHGEPVAPAPGEWGGAE